MKKGTKRNKGVTLVALVVTVVVTIIIASITIGTLLDNNGIIEKSQSSKENAEQQSERVAVEQAVTSAMTQDRYGKVEEEILKEELENSTEGTKIETYDDIFTVIVTFEETGRIYEVDVETGEVTPIEEPLEKVGIRLRYSLQKTGREWKQDGSEWTNDNVVVTVDFDESNSAYKDWKEDKTIMYRLEKDTEWKEYDASSKIVSERNQKVYVKVQGEENRTKVVEGEIKYIDKIRPIVREVEIAGKEIKIEATDEQSGIVGYAITTTPDEPTQFTSCTNTKEFNKVVTASTSGRNYYVWVKDAAGNIGSSEDILTAEVPNGNEITISHTPTSWTNGSVVATASSSNTGYEIQMSKDNRNWTTTERLTVEENGTIYARFWDGIVGGRSTSHQITNIDKIKPTITVNPESSTASKIKEVTITVGDEGGSGLSSSNRYEYYLSTSSSTQTGGSWEDYASGESFIIGENLTGTYYLHIREISDNATNTSSTGGSVNGAQVYGPYVFSNEGPTIEISPNSQSNYTKTASVTITVKDNSGTGLSTSNSYEYYLSTSSTEQEGGSWESYTSGNSFIIGENLTGKYYLHVKEVIDNVGNMSGPKVSGAFNFDNTAPIISVSPSSTTAVKSQAITITTSDTGGSDLSISNSCQYYLSTSSTSFSGGDWITYKSGVSQTIGTGLNGTYYLFVKQIRDNATNVSSQTGTIVTIGGTKYHRFGPYTFNNTKPKITISGVASEKIATEITVTGNGNTDGEGIEKIVWYYKKTNETTYSKIETTLNTSSQTATDNKLLQNLTPETTYDIYAEIYDYADGTATSENIQVTTGPGVALHVETGIIYTKVQYAVDAVPSKGNVRLLRDWEESVTIAESKDITYDPNNKTLSHPEVVIDNYGILTIANTGTITTIAGAPEGINVRAILNRSTGKLNISNGTFIGIAGWTIENNGEMDFSGGMIRYTRLDNGTALFNRGVLSMTDGTIESYGHGLVGNTASSITNTYGGNIIAQGGDRPAVLAGENGKIDCYNTTITSVNNAVWLSCRLDDISEGEYIHLFNCSITGKIINRVHSPSAIVEVQTTSTGYTIYYYDSEHNSRIVRFPTWTTNNGQDDLQEQWYVANQTTRHECNAYYYTVNKSNHNNESGIYNTHIYEYDENGNGEFRDGISVNVN